MDINNLKEFRSNIHSHKRRKSRESEHYLGAEISSACSISDPHSDHDEDIANAN